MLFLQELKYPMTIFRRDYNGNVFYSISVCKETKDKKNIYGAIPCQFKNKEISLENKQQIMIKKAYVDWYTKGYETKVLVRIVEFELVNLSKEDSVLNNAIQGFSEEMEFGEQFEDIFDI